LGRRDVHIHYYEEASVKKQPKRPKLKWVDNIIMDIGRIMWGVMSWIDLAQNRNQWRALLNTIINLRVPWNSWNFLSSCTTGAHSMELVDQRFQ
jgi:hypothetical protein